MLFFRFIKANAIVFLVEVAFIFLLASYFVAFFDFSELFRTLYKILYVSRILSL